MSKKYLKTMENRKVELTPNQVLFISSFNKEKNNDEEILWGTFSYRRDSTFPKDTFEFYEFPLIDYPYLEYMGWKHSKKYKNTVVKGFYDIHIDKRKDYMTLREDKGLWDDGPIYHGKIPTQEEFLLLLKLLKIN